MSTPTPLPREIVHRLRRVRDEAQRASHELDAHGRDLMFTSAQKGAVDAVDALAHVQLVRSLVDEAILRLEQALKEVDADVRSA